jgi:hypothetical protein
LDAYYGIKSKIIETELLAEFQASTILNMKLGTNLRKLHHKLATSSGVTIICNCDFQWGS